MAIEKRVNVPTSERRRAGRGGSKRKPALGQNFLRDEGAAQDIADALGDITSATVIEIGAGRGALTSVLAQRAGRLIAIELDRMLAAQLRMKFARHANLEIIEADILRVNLPQLIARKPLPLLAEPVNRGKAGPVLVVGNLPYYITSDILLHLFKHHALLQSMVVMVQREVADRVAAAPGSRDYGLLTATAQLYVRVEKLFTLPPGAFAPAPKVHSTVLRMTVAPQAAELGVEEGEFIEFLKQCFAQKRKTLLNNLRQHYSEPQVRAALQFSGVRADVRAEALALEQMAALYRGLRSEVPHTSEI